MAFQRIIYRSKSEIGEIEIRFIAIKDELLRNIRQIEYLTKIEFDLIPVNMIPKDVYHDLNDILTQEKATRLKTAIENPDGLNKDGKLINSGLEMVTNGYGDVTAHGYSRVQTFRNRYRKVRRTIRSKDSIHMTYADKDMDELTLVERLREFASKIKDILRQKLGDLLKRNEKVSFESTSFWTMLRIIKIRTLVLNPAFFIGLLPAYLVYNHMATSTELGKAIDYISDTIASISATILGIVIAGLAILIALAQGRILNLLLQRQVLQRFLFPFWLLSGFWASSTAICILLKIFENLPREYLLYGIGLEAFIFTYSMISTVSLMGHSIRLGIFLATIDDKD